MFEAIIESLTIRNISEGRKNALYPETYAAFSPGGVFSVLEHVTPVSAEPYRRFL